MLLSTLFKFYKELCLNLTYKFFPDYERAGVIHCLKVVRMCTDLIATSILIASCVGISWIDHDDIASYGLWRQCFTIVTSSSDTIEPCRELTGDDMTFTGKSCRIFIVMSCLCMLSAVMLSAFGIFTSRSHGLFHSISTLSGVTCAILGLVLFSTPTSAISSAEETFGWAYILGWTSVAFSFVCWLLIYCTMSAFNDWFVFYVFWLMGVHVMKKFITIRADPDLWSRSGSLQ